ncbi:MAG: hydantoinase/oxoprolinase family protein [Hyphomicrobium sp.]|nr:hydantoinase/oxoprolinase family protein [Hyphomicrobium sp.]
MTITAGLDVGGAHLKVALVEDGRAIAAEQFRCRLWMGLEKLDTAFGKAAPMLARAERFAVTMTGELSDVFPDRATGVETLVRLTAERLGPATQYWMALAGFGPPDEAARRPADVGSTNFLASAKLVAAHHPDALLIDFGSTTTDIIPIRAGRPAPRGLTDAERQTTGELVYTGFTRTSVAMVAARAPFRGQWVTLAREHLATMADVRRMLGTLPQSVDLHATADGKGKSAEESRVRLARLLGRDAAETIASDWKEPAQFICSEQMHSISDGASLVLSAAGLPDGAPVVAAGIGASEVAAIPALRSRTVITFGTMIGAAPNLDFAATAYAPAVSVALLAEKNA